MYRLEYLPIAMQDMVDIVEYIRHSLSNPAAAERLADEMVRAADGLVDFPYAYHVHHSIRPLQYEYRCLLVQNYRMFYFIDEKQKLITITRVIYARRNYEELLE